MELVELALTGQAATGGVTQVTDEHHLFVFNLQTKDRWASACTTKGSPVSVATLVIANLMD